MQIRDKAYSAIRWTTAAAGARAIINLSQVTLLTRILGPREYGLMAIISVVQTFATIFSDMGINSAYVQRQDVGEAQRSSLFWFNIFLSLLVALALALCSSAIASFYSTPELKNLLRLSALPFVFAALGQQVRMTAEKALDFRGVALVEALASVCGFICAITLAIWRHGVVSIVAGNIVASCVGMTLSWIYLSNGWRPILRLSLKDVRPYLAFGAATMGSNLVNNLNLSVDVLIGGRLLSASLLGLYSVPRNLMLQLYFLINPIVTRVGFPLIAKLQCDRERISHVYLKTVALTASTNAPMYFCIAAFAPELSGLLFGERFRDSAYLMRVLALWGFVRSTGNPVGGLLLGTGRAGAALKWNIALALTVPISLALGARYGVLGLATSLLGSTLAATVPLYFYLVRPSCGRIGARYAVAVVSPAGIAAVSFVGAATVCCGVRDGILKLLVGTILGATAYLALSFRFNRGWVRAIYELAGLGQGRLE